MEKRRRVRGNDKGAINFQVMKPGQVYQKHE